MNRNLQSMVQIFIRIVSRSIGRQEKHLNFVLAVFQPGRSKLAVMDFQIVQDQEHLPFETRIRRSINRISRCWFIVSWQSIKRTLDRGELFAPAGLTRDYHQRILRLHIWEKEGEEPEMEFLEADCLQSPDMAASSGFPTRWIDPKNEMEMIRLLYGSLMKGLGRADDGTFCLLDLAEARHYSQIELLAKMLFLFITGWGVEELKKRPCFFALILPAKEQIWEFVRISSIFYDKLNGRLMEAQIAVCVYPELEDARGDTVQKRVKVPEAAFFLAGGASSAAWVTARTFAYYITSELKGRK